jgi:molybdate transport system ATP-binding protein
LSEVASLCGVESLLKRRPETLSGGERQRVGLARALAPRPRLLLCDEPVSAIDVEGRAALVERLRAVVRSEGIPALYVTHSPGEAVALGSKLFLIANGRLLAQGPPLDVLVNHRHESTGWLDGVRNTFQAVVVSHQPEAGETRLRLPDGPELIVPHNKRPIGATASVAVRADDVLLARGPVEGLSARNLIAGVVGRVIAHGAEAEVVVQSGRSIWLVSVVASAVAALGLAPGVEVRMIVKARSCHLLGDDDV